MTSQSPQPAGLIGASIDAALSMARAGRQAAAEQMLEALAEHGADRAAAMYQLGLMHLRRGNAPAAANWIARSLELDPSSPEAHYNLATARFIEGDFRGAAESYGAAAARNGDDPRSLNGKARSLFRLKRDDEALEVIRPLLEQDPPFPASVDIAALIEHRQGKTKEALARVRKSLSAIRLQNQDRVRLNYTAGMLCDALGDYDTAFEYYRVANTYKAKPYQPRSHSKYIDRIIEVFSPEFIRAHRGNGPDSTLPVFVVGMPRSGTTLTEQILSGHPAIAGAGETPVLWTLAQDLATKLSWPGPYPGCMKAWSADAAARIGGEFIADLRARFPDARRVVDKLPGNFMHLGLIACMLPGAKIIHCVRDPLDTCLSCYFQNFAGNMQPFACDLNHIAAYYKDYRRLMDHWRDACGIEILEVRYEDTVADLEKQARRMIEHLDLPWDDACLNFHESKRVIATASFDQADKPIYDQSVGRWKHYERNLGPLKQALGLDAPGGGA